MECGTLAVILDIAKLCSVCWSHNHYPKVALLENSCLHFIFSHLQKETGNEGAGQSCYRCTSLHGQSVSTTVGFIGGVRL